MGWGALADAMCDQDEVSPWGTVASDICNSQSSSDKLVEEADALASDSDGEVQPEPRPGYSSKVWWARLLEQHTLSLGYSTPHITEPLRLISCCSGGLTEGTAYKDSRFPSCDNLTFSRARLGPWVCPV